MNPSIEQYFDAIEARLIQSPAVVSYRVVRREVAQSDGKLRIQAILSDGGALELFVYVVWTKGYVRLVRYSFHWQDVDRKLRQRWDNVPHYPGLRYAPHHVHTPDGGVDGLAEMPDVSTVIGRLEEVLL